MGNRIALRQFLVIFLVTFVGIFLVLRSSLIGHVAYSVEKGRLRALREAMPSAEEIAAASIPARQVAALVTPTVVFIETESFMGGRDSNAERRSDDSEGPDRSDDHAPRLPDGHPLRVTGLGSGFIIDADRGLILTNAHVVEADVINVQLADGRRYVARVVESDPETDLAVIAIDADRLHQVSFGDSDRVQVGDDVFALGNPFGLAGTVSKGIISAKGRTNVNIGGIVYRGFLQTDAVINPGNSGGPLVNARGEVVGVNTAIATQTGRYDGVGFAIPTSRVQAVLPDLIAGRTVVRGFMGIRPVDVTEEPELAAQLGWNEPYGAIIEHVEADSGAERCGLQAGDIVVTLDGERVETRQQLFETVANLSPGSELDVRFWRDGKTITRRITLGRRPPATR